MPLFRYLCDDCGAENEILVRDKKSPVCPECESRRLVKQLSRVNAVNSGGEASMGCGAEACCKVSGQPCMN